jgi:predicted ATPase
MITKVFLISANGSGAGKTTLANILADVVVSHADIARRDLSRLYPEEFTEKIVSKKQEDKAFILPDGRTVRQALVHYCEAIVRPKDDVYFAREVVKSLADLHCKSAPLTVAIDDVRRVQDMQKIKEYLKKEGLRCVHYHVISHAAELESAYDNIKLRECADLIYRYSILGNDVPVQEG